MKRVNNLYNSIAEPENLRLAFWKAQRGKSGSSSVQMFRADLDQNLQHLRQDLEEMDFRFGNYHTFTIYDPKKRTICAADFRERVLQHAVVNICEPYFEKYQIFDSYACRKEKGVDRCLERTQYFCRHFSYYLKLDIHKFFDSVNHSVLLHLLERQFKDKKLMFLFADLLLSYETTPNCGLAIGNLLSQHFANLYLAALDHEIKDRWQIRGYVRYMDDFIIFSQSAKQLHDLYVKISDFLSTQLKLTLNTPVLNSTAHGIPFLSYRVLPDKLRLSLKAKRRFRTKVNDTEITNDPERLLPLLAFINRASVYGFRHSVFYGHRSLGSNRVNRGGSWNNNARNCRSANRNNNSPNNRNNNLGFRVVLAPAQAMDGCPKIEPELMTFSGIPEQKSMLASFGRTFPTTDASPMKSEGGKIHAL